MQIEINNRKYQEIIQEVEDFIVTTAIVRHYGNQSLAALELGINRGTFRKKLEAARRRGDEKRGEAALRRGDEKRGEGGTVMSS